MSPHPLLCFLLLPFLLPSAAQHDGFTFTGFSGAGNASSNSHIAPNGIAEVEPNGLLRLTNITSRLIGHAFYPTPIRLKDSNASSTAYSFSTSFVFAFIPEFATLGGHGLAFALTPSPLLPGALPSQYLGLLSAADNGNATNHILAVEFDTVQDFEFGDINDNHVGINLNSMTSNASAAVSYIAVNGTRTNLTMKTGALVQAWIDYDGVSNVLNVSIAPASAAYSKPNAPLLSYPVNIAPVLHDSMYVGFSASTGLLASSHYIFGWSFKVNAAAAHLDLSALPSIPKPKKRNTTLVTVAASVAVAAAISVIAAAAYLCYRIRNADIIEQWELDYGPHRFSYSELKRATKGFSQSELLGFGGFGKVYKGKLNGSDVAVKRVSHESRQGLREFVAEIASYRAVLEVYLSFHENDEFWYTNAPNDYITANNLTSTPGNGPLREVIATIDGKLIGTVAPFTVIHTGGINPLLWRPITAIGSFDLPTYDIEITPFLGKLLDGKQHEFGFSVTNALNVWYVDANLHLWLDPKSLHTSGELIRYDATGLSLSLDHQFNGLDGVFSTKASRRISATGWVKSSYGTITTHSFQSVDYKNRMEFAENGSTQIVNQTIDLNYGSYAKDSSAVLYSEQAFQNFPLYVYQGTADVVNDTYSLVSNVSLGLNVERLLGEQSGFSYSSLRNLQNADGYMKVKGNLVTSGLGSTSQVYKYDGTDGCYYRDVSSRNYTFLHDKSGESCTEGLKSLW